MLETPPAQTTDVLPGTLMETVELDAKLTRTLSRLHEVARYHALRLAHDVGRIVWEDLFDGDFEAFARRSEGPWMRALSEHPELPFSAVILSRSCSVYELMERLGIGVQDTPLTLSHFRAVLVLGAAAPRRQVELLDEAQEQGWTAEQLAARVAEVDLPRPRGRRTQHVARKALAALSRLVEARLSPLTGDDDALAGLARDEVGRLLDALGSAERELASLRARLEEHRGAPPQAPAPAESLSPAPRPHPRPEEEG